MRLKALPKKKKKIETNKFSSYSLKQIGKSSFFFFLADREHLFLRDGDGWDPLIHLELRAETRSGATLRART